MATALDKNQASCVHENILPSVRLSEHFDSFYINVYIINFISQMQRKYYGYSVFGLKHLKLCMVIGTQGLLNICVGFYT